MQNYAVFQPMYRYFKQIAGADNGSYIYYWQSKGLPDEKIKLIQLKRLTQYYSKIKLLWY